MNPYLGLAFDAVTLLALAFAAWRGWHLSRQFEKMQADRQAFEKLIQALNLASARAEAAIVSLREAASGGGEALQDRLNKSRAMSEELEIMIQAGDSLAGRLEALATSARESGAMASVAGGEESLPRTRAERDLQDAVKSRQKTS